MLVRIAAIAASITAHLTILAILIGFNGLGEPFPRFKHSTHNIDLVIFNNNSVDKTIDKGNATPGKKPAQVAETIKKQTKKIKSTAKPNPQSLSSSKSKSAGTSKLAKIIKSPAKKEETIKNKSAGEKSGKKTLVIKEKNQIKKNLVKKLNAKKRDRKKQIKSEKSTLKTNNRTRNNSRQRQAGSSKTGDNGRTVNHGFNSVLRQYSVKVLAHLNKYKQYPSAARRLRLSGKVGLKFVIAKDGKLLMTKIIRSSGHAALDREVMAMTRRARNFPAIPPELARTRLTFTTNIIFTVPSSAKTIKH